MKHYADTHRESARNPVSVWRICSKQMSFLIVTV